MPGIANLRVSFQPASARGTFLAVCVCVCVCVQVIGEARRSPESAPAWWVLPVLQGKPSEQAAEEQQIQALPQEAPQRTPVHMTFEMQQLEVSDSSAECMNQALVAYW